MPGILCPTTTATRTSQLPQAYNPPRRRLAVYHRRAHEAASFKRALIVHGATYYIIATREPNGDWIGCVRDSTGLEAEAISGADLASLERYAIDCLGGNGGRSCE